jgi:hypothetical protein
VASQKRRRGDWSTVTAEEPSGPDVDGGLTHSGDGGPAVEANVAGPRDCTVTPNGSLLVAEVCAVRRIAPDGTISTVVGREDPGGGVWWGCVTGTAETQTTEDMAPVPLLSGPGSEVALTGVQGVAAGGGGRVWFTTSLGLRSLEPNGTVRTWQTPEYGAKERHPVAGRVQRGAPMGHRALPSRRELLGHRPGAMQSPIEDLESTCYCYRSSSASWR